MAPFAVVVLREEYAVAALSAHAEPGVNDVRNDENSRGFAKGLNRHTRLWIGSDLFEQARRFLYNCELIRPI